MAMPPGDTGKGPPRPAPARKAGIPFPVISAAMIRVLLLAAVITVIGALLCRAYYSIRGHMLISKGRALQAQKKWAEAESAYRESLYFDPSSPAAYSSLGECYLMAGDLPRAMLYLAKAAAFRRVPGKGFYYLGALYCNSGEVKSLEKIIRESSGRIIATDKSYMELLRIEASIMFPASAAFRLPPGEEKLLLEKLKQRKDSAFFTVHAGFIHLYRGDFQKAEELFTSLAEMKPGNADYRVYRALACTKNRKLPEAMKELQEALRLDSRNALAYQSLGEIYHEEKLPEEAAKALAKALSLAPGLAGAHYLKGLILY